METEQELARLLDRLLERYPVDPAQRDRLWRCITRSLGPPQPTAAKHPHASG